MNTYKVWAVQVLHDVQEIQANSPEEAQSIAQTMYQETGELDPSEVVDGDCGVCGVDEWVFKFRTVAQDDQCNCGEPDFGDSIHHDTCPLSSS